MTIDEAIEERLKVIKVQEKLYEEAYSDESKEIIKNATDNDRQLVKWLRELKEAKQLLKAAVEDFKTLVLKSTSVCNMKIECNKCPLNCTNGNLGWKKEVEALKLIGEESEQE